MFAEACILINLWRGVRGGEGGRSTRGLSTSQREPSNTCFISSRAHSLILSSSADTSLSHSRCATRQFFHNSPKSEREERSVIVRVTQYRPHAPIYLFRHCSVVIFDQHVTKGGNDPRSSHTLRSRRGAIPMFRSRFITEFCFLIGVKSHSSNGVFSAPQD